MNISPVDIRKHEFRRSIRGFDQDEVIAFHDLISVELEALLRENAVLVEKNSMLESQIRKYRELESALQETLVSAQKTREETLKNTQKEAELVIREAEIKASTILEESRNELSRLRNSYHEAKVQKEAYVLKLKTLVKSQLELLETPLKEEETIERITEPDQNKNQDESTPGIDENNPLENQ